MSDKMAEAAARTVRVRRRSEVTEDVKFSTLTELKAELKAEPLIVDLYNPKTGKTMTLEFRYPTPGELLNIDQSLLSARVITELMDVDGEQVADEVLEEGLSNMAQGTLEKMIVILSLCSTKPQGVTSQVIRGWDPLWIEQIYYGLLELMEASTPVDTFHQVGSDAGESGADTSTVSDGEG